MTTLEILDRLQGDALKDGELRKKLLATRLEKDPLTVFCRLCRELGYELYEMDLVSAGEDFYATMRRSTNGGGENLKRQQALVFVQYWQAALQQEHIQELTI